MIPDFISPRKHYSACEIEIAIEEMEDGTSIEAIETKADSSTLRRWWHRFKEKFAETSGNMKSILFKSKEIMLGELEYAGLKPLRYLEKILEKFDKIETSFLVVGETNIYLTIYGKYDWL